MIDDAEAEFEAFKSVYETLQPLEENARDRVLASISTMLGTKVPSVSTKPNIDVQNEPDESVEVIDNNFGLNEYGEFAELYADADPNTGADKALVAGYWLQICQGSDDFSGFGVNSELNNLGHKLSNVTVSLSSLIKTKPQLVLQLKKTGKSQQSRKTYKLSKAGVDRVEGMLNAA